jgi:ketosteroid isomerase-like protein
MSEPAPPRGFQPFSGRRFLLPSIDRSACPSVRWNRLRDTAAAMAQGDVKFVRKPLAVRKRSSRTLDERLLLRFPKLATASARLLARLPPGSRLRQALLWRFARLGVEAYNRRDLEAIGINYHPQFEYCPARNWVEAGLLEPSYAGAEGHRAYITSTAEVFGSEVYVMPTELIDAGQHLVVLANVPMRAQASGIELTEAFAMVSTMQDGMILRIQEYYDQDEALRAAGLPVSP